jgi:hypothetical protein
MNDDDTLPLVPALPPILKETEAAAAETAEIENQEKKRSAPDNEDEAAKPQKKKRPTAKQIASKIIAGNSKTAYLVDPKSLYAAKPDEEWLQNLFAFHLFRSRNGATANPSTKSTQEDEKRLASWVNANRKLMSRANQETASDITKAKIAALQQIPNFPFQKPFSDRVEQRLNELRAWKEQHGHLHVPTRSGPLGKWVCMSRIKYHNGKLDPTIVTQLEEIGLEWSEWDSRYEELKEYKAKYGDCVVPRREEFKRLNRWVTTQRQNYKIPGKLSQERIVKLVSDDYLSVLVLIIPELEAFILIRFCIFLQEAIDFVWTAGKSSKPKVKLVQEEVYNDYHPYGY